MDASGSCTDGILPRDNTCGRFAAAVTARAADALYAQSLCCAAIILARDIQYRALDLCHTVTLSTQPAQRPADALTLLAAIFLRRLALMVTIIHGLPSETVMIGDIGGKPV